MENEKYRQARRKAELREANPTIEGIDQLVAAIKNGKTLATEQHRLRDPKWNNAGLWDYIHNMTTPIPQKQAGLINPNALKFVLLLSITGFVFYKLIKSEQES